MVEYCIPQLEPISIFYFIDMFIFVCNLISIEAYPRSKMAVSEAKEMTVSEAKEMTVSEAKKIAIKTVKFCLGTMDNPYDDYDVDKIDEIILSGNYLTHLSPSN